jgi:hypothetical protein
MVKILQRIRDKYVIEKEGKTASSSLERAQQEGVQELDVPLVVRPLRWFFCLLGRGSFHCVSPFLGALVYILIGRV